MYNKFAKLLINASSFIYKHRKMSIFLSVLIIIVIILITVGAVNYSSKPKQEIHNIEEYYKEEYEKYVKEAEERGLDPVSFSKFIVYFTSNLDPLDSGKRFPIYGEFKCLQTFHPSLDSIYVRTEDGEISCMSSKYVHEGCFSLPNSACKQAVSDMTSTTIALLNCGAYQKEDPNHWCSKANKYFDRPIEESPKWQCFLDSNGRYQPAAYSDGTIVLPKANTGASAPTEARCNMYIENSFGSNINAMVSEYHVPCDGSEEYKAQCDAAKIHFDNL